MLLSLLQCTDSVRCCAVVFFSIFQGDIILVGLRDFQDSKADVILKYTSDEARRLKAQGELPDNCSINVADKIGEGEDDDIPFDFEEI